MTFIQWWASKLGKIEVVSESNFELMQEAYNTGQAAQAEQAETIAQLEHALVSEAVNKKDYEQLEANNAKLRECLERYCGDKCNAEYNPCEAREALGETE